MFICFRGNATLTRIFVAQAGVRFKLRKYRTSKPRTTELTITSWNWFSMAPPHRGSDTLKLAITQQLTSHFNVSWFIHSQQRDGCSPDWRTSYDLCAGHHKVIVPLLRSRVEDLYQFIGVRRISCEILALECVTAWACERKVAKLIRSSMLSRPNVFYVKREKWRGYLR